MGTIYTIGYGAVDLSRFVALLKQYKIGILIDVRSQPYSKYHPEFKKRELERHLAFRGIMYLFMGDHLGGMPGGTPDYAALESRVTYQDGIKSLIEYSSQYDAICLMCAESKPEDCHRSRLIGETLWRMDIELKHILPDGRLVPHATLHERFVNPQQKLFD